MSGGGTKTYKHPLTAWGGRMRSRLKLPKGCLNCYILLSRIHTYDGICA